MSDDELTVTVLPPDWLWERDDIQFPRLLAEIRASGLTGRQMDDLRASTGLDSNQISALLERAEETFDSIKMTIEHAQGECVSCGAQLDEVATTRELLSLARSDLRALSHGLLRRPLAAPPREVCARITALLGDEFDFDQEEGD